MTIQEHRNKLMQEAQALKHFYSIESPKLREAFAAFDAAYNSPAHVESEEFSALLNAVDAELEDLCIANKITEDLLDDLTECNAILLSKVYSDCCP